MENKVTHKEDLIKRTLLFLTTTSQFIGAQRMPRM